MTGVRGRAMTGWPRPSTWYVLAVAANLVPASSSNLAEARVSRRLAVDASRSCCSHDASSEGVASCVTGYPLGSARLLGGCLAALRGALGLRVGLGPFRGGGLEGDAERVETLAGGDRRLVVAQPLGVLELLPGLDLGGVRLVGHGWLLSRPRRQRCS